MLTYKWFDFCSPQNLLPRRQLRATAYLRQRHLRQRLVFAFILLLGALLAGCQSSPSEAPSALEPQGYAATQIADLWWIMLGMGTVVYLIVIALFLVSLRRGRRRESPMDNPLIGESRSGTRWILIGTGVTLAILLVVFALTVNTQLAVSMPVRANELTVRVTGHQWWWEIAYPDQGITTANEIYIPVGQPVRLELYSEDVIHSFWVPELHGKMDLVPGQTNVFWIQADEPGEYWGLCAEYCGIQHAKMLFVVIAVPQEEFDAWAAQQAQPAQVPTDELALRGQEVFLSNTCVNCHVISGTAATGRLGPDLTHLASRRTLGAGILPNNLGNLGGWVVDPQHIKPGNLMPASTLSGTDLQALLAYLQTLE